MLVVTPVGNGGGGPGSVQQRPIGSGSSRDIPAQISYPNAHTIRFRVRKSAVGRAHQLLWEVWVLYPDAAVMRVTNGTVCYVREGARD